MGHSITSEVRVSINRTLRVHYHTFLHCMEESQQLTTIQLNLSLRYNGIKPVSLYGGSADNLENATPEGTPAWMTINLYYQRQINDYLSATIGLENLMDVHYRPFASGVSAPGRNLIIGVNSKF